MATAAARNDNTKSKDRQGKPKMYQLPTLVKAGVLSTVTAQSPTVSGGSAIQSDGSFRAWLIDDAPAWFRGLYIRHSELVGAWLSGQERARRAVRAAMMLAINRKVRG
jgi:hypothetical protein